MGSCDYFVCIEAKNGKQLKEKIDSERDFMGSENGTGSYCGNWNAKENGYRVLSYIANSYDVAYNYILDNNDKWNCVDAVKVIEKQGTPAQNKRIKTQQELVNTLSNNPRNFIKDWVFKLHHAKSKTKSCKHCNTRLDVTYINTIHCSKCNTSFLTQPQSTKLQKIKEKIKTQEEKLQKMIDNKGGKTKEYWLVGGWCPS